MEVVTMSPIYRTERLSTLEGYKTKIVPFSEGKTIEADLVVNTKYSWGLKKVNESSEYDYIAFRARRSNYGNDE